MKTQKSALLGLALGLAAFGAGCKDTTTLEIPPTPPPPIVVTVTPQSLTLEVGQSAALAASVTGGADTDAKTVTWSTSNASVASVDGSGNVTAVGKGVATVTATSTADTNAKGAASVTVTEVVQPAPPTVSIKSITQFGTTFPVQLNNVFGQIDITLNLDVPAGAKVSALRTYINNTKVCEQTFSGGAEVGATEEVNGASEIICSANTAAYTGTPGTDAQATITFPNGPGYKIKVEILDPQGTTTAQITSADMIFNNPSFIVAVKTAPTNCTTGAAFGTPPATFWCEGDFSANFLPVNFSSNANDAIASITLTETALTGTARTDAAAPWSVTLPKSGSGGNIGGVEGIAALTVNSVTAGGQTGPVCINPDPVLNPVGTAPAPAISCAGTNPNIWVYGTGGLPATQFLLDNKPPTITLFDLTPGTLGCGTVTGCYVSGNPATPAFAFSVRSGFFAHTDGGVGSPTATFMAGVAGSLAAVTTAETLAESVVPNYVAQATSCDKLSNCVTRYAGPTNNAPVSSAGSAQLFGVDSTDPTATINNATPNNSINVGASPAWQISYADAGVGPSGFGTSGTPVSVQLKQTTPGSSVCYKPDAPPTAAVGGTTASGGCLLSSGAINWQADDGNIDVDLTNPGTGEGYWELNAFVSDAAHNFSKPNIQRITLQDLTLPVLGGIAGPSSLPGGQAATFTAAASDNIDLGWMDPSIDYGAVTFQFPAQTLGAYGVADGLVNSSTANFTTNSFMRAIEGTTAAGRTNTAVTLATTTRFDLYDVAGNVFTGTTAISGAVLFAAGGTVPDLATISASIFAPATAAHGNFLQMAPSNATACSGTSTACGSSPPASTVLSATMTGPNATFANPFARVEFYYQDPVNLRWYLIGTGSASASDNTLALTRTWTYSLTWTLTGVKDSAGNLLAGAIPVVAVGVHSSGSAVATTAGAGMGTPAVGGAQVVTVSTT